MKVIHSNRGGGPIIYVVVAGVLCLAGWLSGGLKMPALFQKQPPTKELVAAQQQLAEAQAKEAVAVAALDQIKTKQAADQVKELDYTQQMAAGAAEALDQVPSAQRSAEVQLASKMVQRVENGLVAVTGKALSQAAHDEIVKLVDEALSPVVAERDAALAALEKKDSDLQATALENDTLRVQALAAQSDVEVEKAKAQVLQTKVDTTTAQVVTYAQAKADADKVAGGLSAYLSWFKRLVIIVALFAVGFYLLIHFVLPSLAAEVGAPAVIVKLNKWTRSLTTAHP